MKLKINRFRLLLLVCLIVTIIPVYLAIQDSNGLGLKRILVCTLEHKEQTGFRLVRAVTKTIIPPLDLCYSSVNAYEARLTSSWGSLMGTWSFLVVHEPMLEVFSDKGISAERLYNPVVREDCYFVAPWYSSPKMLTIVSMASGKTEFTTDVAKQLR